jgi:type II secretory pathway component HofQ
VPILSKIPFLGRLFESQSETLIRDAYIILVTVRLQDPSGQPVNR